MRLAAQMRGGFYPASSGAVAFAATFLRPPNQPFAILDPCAGEGSAIQQLAELLRCARSTTYAIELDDGRAEAVHGLLPDAHVLAPANFFGCRAGLNSFSFIWLNPPFDDSYDGKRVEHRFLLTATEWLKPGGVLALVCPENVAGEYTDVHRHFATNYENCMIVPFPDKHRPFGEVIVFGHKRANLGRRKDAPAEWLAAPRDFTYRIPAGTGPRVFQKTEPTETELHRMLEASSLRSYLTVAPNRPLPSPPLALGIGHVALLLASGHLDGVVHPQGKSPHVVRGTSRKREFVSDVTETENSDGSTTTRTTISEKIELMVRTVDLNGRIRTFMEAGADKEV